METYELPVPRSRRGILGSDAPRVREEPLVREFVLSSLPRRIRSAQAVEDRNSLPRTELGISAPPLFTPPASTVPGKAVATGIEE